MIWIMKMNLGMMKKNENNSIIKPELYRIIQEKKGKKYKIEKEFKIPQPLFKRIILTIKKFFVSLK
jgi:hypothetical protein